MQQNSYSQNCCVICHSEASTALFQVTDRLYGLTSKYFDLVRCTGCGLIRLSPQPTPEELVSYYPDSYWFSPDSTAASRFQQSYRRLVLKDHLAFLKRMRGPVLDVGCGGGLLLAMLRERGLHGTGLDSSLSAARAASRDHVPVACGSLTDAPFAPGTFQLITMYHVLEHVIDPGAYLRSAHELLAADGRLVVQVPNASSWQACLLGKRWVGFDVPRHLYTFRDRDLVQLLRSQGFEVSRMKYFSLRDNPASLATSLAPGLDPMARNVRRKHAARLAKDLAYLSITMTALPFAVLEAACRRGATVMVEAMKHS